MSVLETPRILFRGNMAWDPIVTNNNPPVYDEATADNVYPVSPPIREQVAAFRQEAIADVSPTANAATGGPSRVWNPQGTHRSIFYDENCPDPAAPNSKILETCISGVDIGDGASTDDAFVGSPAAFTSMLVDLEPYGSYSSQLFFDSMSFGIAGGCRIFAPRSSPGHRPLHQPRPNPGLLHRRLRLGDLADLVRQGRRAHRRPLTIRPRCSGSARRSTKRTCSASPCAGPSTGRSITTRPNSPPTSRCRSTVAQELIAKLNGGGFQPNPARSKFVGAIGLWREASPPTSPATAPCWRPNGRPARRPSRPASPPPSPG